MLNQISMENIDYIFEKICGKWEKSYTILKLIFLIIFIYFSLGTYFLGDNFDKLSIINLVVLFVINGTLFLIWNITTKRLPISFDDKLQFAILVVTDDEKIDEKIKSLVNECITNINDSIDISKVILLPINYKKSDKEIKQFLDTRGFSIEPLIYLKLNSGNYIDEKITYEKMSIDQIKCFTKVEFTKTKKIYRGEVNLIPDIKLTNYHKNWDYLEANSKVDKHKYKSNLSDLILQYISIYYIYLDEFEASLNILTVINHNNDESLNPSKNKFKIGRFNTIILELLFKLAVDHYYKHKNYQRCFDLMIKSTSLIGNNHQMSFDCNINLAITSYRLDDLENAKLYTQKAKAIKPNSCLILLNEAFFNILDNKPINLAKNYKLLLLRFSILKGTNVLDIIEFISGEKYKHVNMQYYILFEFAEGFLIRHYTDEDLGISILTDFINKYSSSVNFKEELLDLAKLSIMKSNKKPKKNYSKAS